MNELKELKSPKPVKETDLNKLKPTRNARLTREEEASFKYQIERALNTVSDAEVILFAKAFPEFPNIAKIIRHKSKPLTNIQPNPHPSDNKGKGKGKGKEKEKSANDLTNPQIDANLIQPKPADSSSSSDNQQAIPVSATKTYVIDDLMFKFLELIMERRNKKEGAKRYEAGYELLKYYKKANDFRNPEDTMLNKKRIDIEESSESIRQNFKKIISELAWYKSGTKELKEIDKIIDQKFELAQKITEQYAPLLTPSIKLSSQEKEAKNSEKAERTSEQLFSSQQFFHPNKLIAHQIQIDNIISKLSGNLDPTEQALMQNFIQSYHKFPTSIKVPTPFNPSADNALEEIGKLVERAKISYKELTNSAYAVNDLLNSKLKNLAANPNEDFKKSLLSIHETLSKTVSDAKMTLEATIHLAANTTGSINGIRR